VRLEKRLHPPATPGGISSTNRDPATSRNNSAHTSITPGLIFAALLSDPNVTVLRRKLGNSPTSIPRAASGILQHHAIRFIRHNFSV
jgi:hypothetical protein